MTRGDSESDGAARAATPEAERALRWMRSTGAEAELLGEVTRRVQRRRQRQRGVALGVMGGLLAVVVPAMWPERTVQVEVLASERAPAAAVVSAPRTAAISAPQREELPDGTIVELKPGAAFTHDYAGEWRRVTLTRGEAHFQVAKDPARPFVVTAGAVAVRAVGTAFAVQFEPTRVEVLVTEGQVAVERGVAAEAVAGAQAEPALLGAGGRALIHLSAAEPAPEVSAVSDEELAKRLAWRVPQLEFTRTPLPEVIALVNRHGGAKTELVLDLTAAQAEEIKLSGFLAADNAAGLVRLLEVNFGLEAERRGVAIYLRKKTP